MGNEAIIGKEATIGRFRAKVVEDAGGLAGEPLVEFSTADGRAFGSIRLSTARNPIAVDLYEGAAMRLDLPLSFDVSGYCLDAGEMGALREWANSL